MADDPRSAEKDLLKIIEGGAPAAGGTSKSTKVPLSSLATAKDSDGTQKGKRRIDFKKSLVDGRNINRLLVAALACVLVYFMTSFFMESTKLKGAENFIEIDDLTDKGTEVEKEFASELTKAGGEGEADEKAEEEVEEETEALAVRNVFKPGPPPSAQDDAEESDGGVGHLRLVGISMEESAENSYVMIENTTTSVTFFLKVGESLDGMMIEDIQEDRVTLNVQGESLELR